MATTKVTLQEGVWTLVSSVNCIFQNLGNKNINVCESTSTPSASADYKIIEPLEIYEFNPASALNLYAKSVEGISAVTVDPMGYTEVELAPDQEITAKENDNVETSKTAVTTWYMVPTNAKKVLAQLDATGASVSANVEFTLDRAGAIAGTAVALQKWTHGAKTNAVAYEELPAVAAIRMTDLVTNAVSEVKSSYTTALAGANNDMVYTSKLIGTAGDAITIAYIDNGLSVDEVKSNMTTALVGDNNDIVYTSKLTGTAGDAITVAYIDPSAVDQTLSVDVTGTAIVVNLATDAGGLITSTADDIKTAIATKAEAHALVGTADAALNDGSGVVTAMVATPLANGVDPVVKALSVVVTGTDIVVNLAADTSAITTTAADIKTAIEGTPAAHALVGLANAGADTGAGVVTALAETHLANGVNAVAATLPKLFITVQ